MSMIPKNSLYSLKLSLFTLGLFGLDAGLERAHAASASGKVTMTFVDPVDVAKAVEATLASLAQPIASANPVSPQTGIILAF